MEAAEFAGLPRDGNSSAEFTSDDILAEYLGVGINGRLTEESPNRLGKSFVDVVSTEGVAKAPSSCSAVGSGSGRRPL